MSVYTWAIGQGMPEGIRGDEQEKWLMQRDYRKEAEVNRLAAELAEARAIVDKLPKTRDGKPAHSDMRLYFRHPELNEIWDWRVVLRPSTKSVPSVDDSDDFYEYEIGDCYSTREAAQAAGKGR